MSSPKKSQPKLKKESQPIDVKPLAFDLASSGIETIIKFISEKVKRYSFAVYVDGVKVVFADPQSLEQIQLEPISIEDNSENCFLIPTEYFSKSLKNINFRKENNNIKFNFTENSFSVTGKTFLISQKPFKCLKRAPAFRKEKSHEQASTKKYFILKNPEDLSKIGPSILSVSKSETEIET